VRGQEPERVRVLEQGLVQVRVRGRGLALRIQQPPIRLALPLPSPKLISVFYSFSPPKILELSCVSSFLLKAITPLNQ